MRKARAYLRLTRPANQLTAVSDVLAGIAMALFVHKGVLLRYPYLSMACLCVSTACLYGGGVVFNDFFDHKLDKVERPERPLPAGIVKPFEAVTLGSTLFSIGVAAAFLNNNLSGLIGITIVFAALAYDKVSKHIMLLGPVNMGICRSLNLLLGMSILPEAILHIWYISLVPIIYIASITLISQGEVAGGKKSTLYFASFLYALVILIILGFIVETSKIYWSILLIIPFITTIFIPLFKAINNPIALNIRTAVKSGILALIILNAIWAASANQWIIVAAIVTLLPASIFISKTFAVT